MSKVMKILSLLADQINDLSEKAGEEIDNECPVCGSNYSPQTKKKSITIMIGKPNIGHMMEKMNMKKEEDMTENMKEPVTELGKTIIKKTKSKK